jgi:copper transport protein
MRPATARRRRVVFAVALLGAFAAVAPAAGAHARLVGSDPADGSALARAPGNVRLQFNEGISASFRRVVLLDGQGRAVAGTRVTRGRDAREIVIGVPPLGRGTYQLDWEVLAQQDGHVSGGAMAFGVRARPALAPRTAAGAAPPPPEALLRWLDFLLLAGLLGGLAMSLLIARAQTRGVSGAAVRVARRRVLTGAAWSGGLAVAFGGVILIRQAHALPATQPGGLSLPEAAGRLLAIRWGVLWSAREALLAGLVLTALLLRGRRAAGGAYAAAAAMALALVTIRALGGHAAAVRPSGTAVAADAVHLLAAALWIGGLAALALILRPAQHAAELARACRRPFAWTAAVSVVALAATGLYAAGAQVASVDALLTTFYGKTLIAKTALVLVAGALGLSSSMLLRALAHGRPERRAALSRLMLAELAAGLYVLLAAGLLTASSPPRGPEFAPSRIARPPTLVAQVGDVLVSATARPNRPGVNVFSVLAVSSRRPPPEPIERASLLVAPAGGPASAVALHELAPGRYSGGARLPRSGRWRMTVVLERGGRRLSTGFAWAVAAPAGARPVVVSARRLAPLLDRAAAALLIALAAGALTVAAWRRRPPRRRASPRAVSMIDPLGKEAP